MILFLQFVCSETKHEKIHIFDVIAYENTWIHQRKKERERRRQERKGQFSTSQVICEDEVPAKKARLEEDITNTEETRPLLLRLNIALEETSDGLQILLTQLDGSHDKTLIHQVKTYLQNNLERIEKQ